MKRFFCILLVSCSLLGLVAQNTPQLLPKEYAMKQTEMVCRELDITDSVQRHKIFSMHLKYAEMREISNTRMEALERMQNMTEELKGILTAEQYDRFMNRQITPHPRTPQKPYGSMPSIPSMPKQLPPEDRQ